MSAVGTAVRNRSAAASSTMLGRTKFEPRSSSRRTASVTAGWACQDVDVPRPLRAATGWVVHGWGAQTWMPGSTAAVAEDPDWFRRVHVAFHRAVADLPRPGFLDTRDDVWSYGDRVAWEDAEPVGSAETRALQRRALDHLEPVDLSAQVVHGDLGGNVLRDADRATVIDWPPYWLAT